ncbi:MAG: hypothetical protein EOP53_03325 [Sphingobacteriales bacterium]|nr:MAG: hypothetical protein EOP53_03325 [Sphingobacteriales bacterium]
MNYKSALVLIIAVVYSGQITSQQKNSGTDDYSARIDSFILTKNVRDFNGYGVNINEDAPHKYIGHAGR